MERMFALDLSGTRIVAESSAYSIGGYIRPDDVREVINRTNQEGHLIHAVRLNGIPLQDPNLPIPAFPQDEGITRWCIGTRIFSQTPDIPGNLQHRSTPFFEHGSYLDEHGNVRMDMAITNKKLLEDIPKGHRWTRTEEDTEIPIESPVPTKLVHILSVQVNKRNCPENPRILTQMAEQQMFQLIENAVINGYEPGQQTVVRI